MKTRIIIIVSAVLATHNVSAQEADNTFSYVERQCFQNRTNGYQASIQALSTDNDEQTEIFLPLPDNGRKKERYARSQWVNDFCFDDDYLLVTTQKKLINYKRIHNQNYQVVSTYRHHNLCMGNLHRNKINFFEEYHKQWFKRFQQDLGSDSAVLVRELLYEAPHVVQIQPNRYLSHNQQSVFFLSTRFPRMEASGGNRLLLFMQFDTLTGKSVLQYAIQNENGLISRYFKNIHEDSVYHAARFPFTLSARNFSRSMEVFVTEDSVPCQTEKIVPLRPNF